MKNSLDYSLITTIERLILKDGLLLPDDKVVVGVSGGADSVCLLMALYEISKRPSWELTLYPVHVNHGIRGEEALRDELFVKELCQGLELEAEVFHENVPALAKELSMSSEEVGRMVRYRDFIQVCNQNGCSKIAVAHNGNDQTETILFNALRGCSLNGLSGMKTLAPCAYDDGIELIRPLLETSREEIERYLNGKGLRWCVDSTNLEEDYTRNVIRHSLIPAILKISPRADEHIKQLGCEAAEAKNFIDGFCDEIFKGAYNKAGEDGTDCELGELRLENIKNQPDFVRRELLYRFICALAGRKKDIERIHVQNLNNLIENSVGKMVCLPYDINIVRTYDSLLALKRSEKAEEAVHEETPEAIVMSLDSTGQKDDAEGRYLSHAGFELRNVAATNFSLPEFKAMGSEKVFFDLDKVKKLCRRLGEAMIIRTRREEDYMCPFPDGRKKALSRIFIDGKLAAELRNTLPLLCIGSRCLVAGNIRHDETLRVDESTEMILEVTFKN